MYKVCVDTKCVCVPLLTLNGLDGLKGAAAAGVPPERIESAREEFNNTCCSLSESVASLS